MRVRISSLSLVRLVGLLRYVSQAVGCLRRMSIAAGEVAEASVWSMSAWSGDWLRDRFELERELVGVLRRVELIFV